MCLLFLYAWSLWSKRNLGKPNTSVKWTCYLQKVNGIRSNTSPLLTCTDRLGNKQHFPCTQKGNKHTTKTRYMQILNLTFHCILEWTPGIFLADDDNILHFFEHWLLACRDRKSPPQANKATMLEAIPLIDSDRLLVNFGRCVQGFLSAELLHIANAQV